MGRGPVSLPDDPGADPVAEAIARATAAQAAAADPARSAWVGANAGSGKTRVLTERVARLLFAGADPAGILCLTYTKAAAVEMRTRLFAKLGRWAMAEEAALAEEIARLEGAPPAAGRVTAARRLFAQALETPGGLKIQTIHAFAEALLRRFPLEAGLSPRFELIDDRQAALIRRRIRVEMAAEAEAGRDAAFDGLAAMVEDARLDQLVDAIRHAGARAAWHPDPVELPGAAMAAAVAGITTDRWHGLSELAAAVETGGGASGPAQAAALREAVGLAASDPAAAFARLRCVFLTEKGTPRKKFPTKATCRTFPEGAALAQAMADWVLATHERVAAAAMAERSAALGRFAESFLARFAAQKSARALADFDDLLAGAAALLASPDLGSWVLYRLDATIGHVLVDEAQDTSPLQWRIVEALTAEFFAGHTAREGRTLFVVGDEKQSIFSFQGADPRAFSAMRARIGARAAAHTPIARPALDTSFRSAPGILGFVDRVFAESPTLSLSGEAVVHRASRARDASRVDLWPLVASEGEQQAPDWWEPEAPEPRIAGEIRLARLLAAEIARMIAEERRPARDGRPGGPVRPGDVMVLVRRRSALSGELLRALKRQGVPVAGADRLRLAASLAAQDLTALVKAAIQPADELSLAAVLRSPLGGLSEEALFRLAHGREGGLAAALAASEHAHAAGMMADLGARAGELRPYEFLSRALIAHDGRRRLVARLGPEAEDVIDELLEQALAVEARTAPTLAGFVDWIEAADVEIKREMDQTAGAVRVMTVHGAKGLEAPVVILADTAFDPARSGGARPRLVPAGEGDGEPMLWLPPRAEEDARAAAARMAADARAAEERARLLYVALTRAEDWLILCGASDKETAPKGSWYAALAAAHGTLGPVEVAGPEGLRIARIEDQPVPVSVPVPEPVPAPLAGGAPPEEAATGRAPSELPAWLAPAPQEPRPLRLTPSRLLDGAEAAPRTPVAGSAEMREPGAALAHGRAVHRILERLAECDGPERARLAQRLLAAEMPELGPEAQAAALAEAERVLAAPFAAEIFGPGSLAEAGLAIALPALPGLRMTGRVDRLVVGPEDALVVDFKTDRAVPAAPGAVPRAYLGQLAAYVHAVGRALADRPVRAAILWTAAPTLMPLPATALEGALAEVTSIATGMLDRAPGAA